MRRLTRKLNTWTSKWLDLPQDVLYDMPRYTLIGNRQLVVENHSGLLHFSETELILQLAEGRLEITGEQLVIRSILTAELLVEGRIDQLRFIDGKPL
ncbi:sporulation protein YqfC [Paenibacillus sp. y28]|uniref:sporulation protein YqfC n=1 Tax=Paenibacillus sp. y28 TaxID=3129110 RepID=UPI0030182C1B